MKRNWKSRVFAGFLCFVLMFGLLPTGILSELMPELVPDTAVNADAALKDFSNVNGLFRIKDSATGLYMTATAGNGYNVTVKWQAYSESNRGQCWLINSTNYQDARIRPLSAVLAYANDRTGHGDMWLRRLDDLNLQDTTRVWSYAQADNSEHSADSGNPTGNQWLWRFTQGGGGLGIVSVSGDTFGAYLSNPDAYYYIYNNGGIVDQTSSGNSSYLHFEPTYDPDMSYNGPLVIGNQPSGNTTYWLTENSGAINMPQATGKADVSAAQNQTWALVKSSPGYFFIVNRSSGKYLGANNQGALSAADNTGESYQWQVFKQRDDGTAGAVRIVNKYTGRTLYFDGSTPTASFISNPQDMHQYISLSYNRQFGSDTLWSNYYITSFASSSSIYWPATFDDKSYISIKLNSIMDTNQKWGYYFNTAANDNSIGVNAKSTVTGNAAGYVENSAVKGFTYAAPSYSPDVGNVRVKFTFTKNSTQNTSPFLIIEGHYNQGTTSVTIKNSSGTTVASGSQAGYGRKEISIGNLANGTYTLELSGGEHYGIFTNITPDSVSGTPSMTLTDTNSVNSKAVHSDVSYALKITNPRPQAISRINFSVTVKEGSSTVATLTYNNGTFSGNNTYATMSGGANQIAANNGTATWTITLLYSGMSAGKSYSVSIASDGSCYTFAGNAAPSNSGISRATNTLTVTKCNGGGVTASVAVNPNGGIVANNIVYTITLKNTCNHDVNNISFTFGKSGTTLLVVANGAENSKLSGVTVSGLSSGKKLSANGIWEITVTVPVSALGENTGYQFAVSGGTAAGTNIQGSHAITFTSSNTTSVTTVSGTVEFTVSSNVSNNAIVKGDVIYTIKITNKTNHKVNNVNFILKADGIVLLEVTNGTFTTIGDGVTISINSIGEIDVNGITEFTVTVDTTALTQGETYGITTSKFTCYGSNLASGQSRELSVDAKTVQSITTATGSVTVGLTSSTVNNNGVGEGDVEYTITLKNDTNHALKDITFVLKDNAGNTLLTVNANGTITVVDNTLVKNGGSVSGSLTNLASGATVTITDIVIDADADVLDDSGRLILTATGNSAANGVAGFLGDSLTYADTSDTFTIMVRHDVDLLVQAGVNTTIDRDKIFAAMNKSGAYGPEKSNGLAANTISAITLTDANGNSISNANITINGSNLVIDLTAEYGEYIIKVTYSGGSILVPIQVTTVDAGEDKTFVLDYGLPVSIDMATMLNDLRLTGGSYPSISNAVTGFSAAMSGAGASTLNGTFGNFAFENDAFGYTTSKFMDNEDFAYIVILVGGNGTENVDYVNVYKKVSFIPSNVIYYEDTLVGSITYPGGYTLDALGELASIGDSLIQDLPTTGNMGFDDGSYAGATDVMLSGESVQKVTVNGDQVTVSFTFTGTGFELISRVNAKDAATLLIHVTDPSGATKIYPVITRFDPNGNGSAEVYQVPVFRLNEVAYGSYDVQIVGLPKQEFDETGNVTKTETSFIYIDGIRVYNPLGNSDLTNHYGDEQGAEFTNLRDLILAGQGMVAEYTNDVTSFTSGSYYYVATEDKWFTAAMGSVNELGAIGANNEILIRQNAGNHIVVLKVKETSTGAGLLQIGVHDIHDAKFDGSDGANESTSVSYKTTNGWTPLIRNTYNGTERYYTYSGTEQYYEIDLSQCPTDGEYKIVILQVDSGFASFTNIKHKNVTFGQTGPGVLDIYTTPGYFFDEEGNMCSKDEAGNKKIEVEAGEMVNITELNGIMAQDNAENE